MESAESLRNENCLWRPNGTQALRRTNPPRNGEGFLLDKRKLLRCKGLGAGATPPP